MHILGSLFCLVAFEEEEETREKQRKKGKIVIIKEIVEANLLVRDI